MNRKEHWNRAYETSPPDDVSWFQSRPTLSLELIGKTDASRTGGVIDVGGGASVLVDFLLDDGFQNLAVLDISPVAMEHARRRLGQRADSVEWIEADVTSFAPPRQFAIWHDRAVFHFLVEKSDREKYVEAMKRTLAPQGYAIIATFAVDGPEKCSGLSVSRYNAETISRELGVSFRLLGQVDEIHVTPWATKQQFAYFLFGRNNA